MITTDEYYRMCHVVDKLDDIGGYIVSPLAISNKIYGGFDGVSPKEILMVPEIFDSEGIYVFDDETSLRAWQKWFDKPSPEKETPKLNVVPFNKNNKSETDEN